MFEPADAPRVFAVPLGVDFTAALIDGIDARLTDGPPEALARVEIIVNSDRMRRRLMALYGQRGASFLPRITPVAALSARPELSVLPPAMSPLRLRLELARLVGALLDQEPGLAPRHAIYDLADSLAELMAEMHEEGVGPEALAALDMGDMARHWDRNRRFVEIVAGYFEASDGPMAPEARAAAGIAKLADLWAAAPPEHPVIVAGSTGSRGTTARLMRAVAGLPQGAVVLPGLDRDMAPEIWDGLIDGRRGEGLAGEDHPQFRNGAFIAAMGMRPAEVPDWATIPPAAPDRNRWMSLALRPAPVTDAWLAEG
ncbi:double-strand break repair protein AddB, partial [Rhodobacterales bacterium HKCCE3408]|nr:double-strand break repair protein AddB [Rhodobacterales bacterium HKCCE3408]